MSYAEHWTPRSLAEAMFQIDTAARSADEFWARGALVAQSVARYMPNPWPNTVVDYGCGIGRVLLYMPGLRRIGIDVSAEMLDYARLCAPGCGFIRGEGRSIPLEDGSVNFLYSLLTLQHMDAADTTNIVRETARVLLPGGRCYLQFSGFGVPWEADKKLPRSGSHWTGSLDGSWCGAHGAIAYDEKIITALARDAGLKIIQIMALDDNAGHIYYTLVGET